MKIFGKKQQKKQHWNILSDRELALISGVSFGLGVLCGIRYFKSRKEEELFDMWMLQVHPELFKDVLDREQMDDIISKLKDIDLSDLNLNDLK